MLGEIMTILFEGKLSEAKVSHEMAPYAISLCCEATVSLTVLGTVHWLTEKQPMA